MEIARLEELDTRVRAEKLDSLFGMWKISLIGNLLGGLFVLYFCWEGVEPLVLQQWFLFLVLINSVRGLLAFAYLKTRSKEEKPDGKKLSYWYWVFQFCLLVHTLIWVSPLFFAYTDKLIVYLLYITMVHMAFVGAGMLGYTASRVSMSIYMLAIILPNLVRYLMLGTDQAHSVALMLFIYMFLVFGIVRRGYKLFDSNVRISIENEILSLNDPLTGLGNRRQMEIYVEQLLASVARHQQVFSLLILDLDHFKEYNDQHGHSKGDELLQRTARILKESVREEDMVIRFGGEEFIVLLPGADVIKAAEVSERVRLNVMHMAGNTISGGIAEHKEGMGFESLLQEADRNLYLAKEKGRNRIFFSNTLDYSIGSTGQLA